MPRQLLVLRHAKSAWDTNASSDFERPLNARGRRNAPRMGRWLRDNGLVPDHVVSSPARRARDTALMVFEAFGPSAELMVAKQVVWDERIYAAGLDGLLTVLADCPGDSRRVMLVGHNPGLERLVTHLGGANLAVPPDGKLLPTAAVACLDMPQSWKKLARGSGKVVSVTRPKSLDD